MQPTKNCFLMINMLLRSDHAFAPSQDHLLAALPETDYECLLPHLEPVPLKLGQALQVVDKDQGVVYFRTTCIASLLHVMPDGALTKIAVVGNDGAVGIVPSLGSVSIPSRAVVQQEGYAYRLKGNVLKRRSDRIGTMQNLLLRFTQALLRQMAQTAVCNRHYTVEQQLCRLLLISIDRLPSNELTMTQELIPNKLGVRREGVTGAAGHLQTAEIIEYHRGHITVLDRSKLEEQVYECYAVVKREYDRLLPYDAIQTAVAG